MTFSMVAIVWMWNPWCSSWQCDIITPMTDRGSLAADTWPRKAAVCLATMTFCHVSDVYHSQLSVERQPPAAEAASLRSSAQTRIPWTCVLLRSQKNFPPSGNSRQEGGSFAAAVQMRRGGKREAVSMNHRDGKRGLMLKEEGVNEQSEKWWRGENQTVETLSGKK